MNSKKGFTLIEMLVVVAIIGILSSVILTALGPGRDKAKDARIIQEVGQVRSLAESFYNNGGYAELEEAPGTIVNDDLRVLVVDINAQGGDLTIRKVNGGAGYIVYSKLNAKVTTSGTPTDNYYCVDNTGRVSFTTTDLSSATRCPL